MAEAVIVGYARTPIGRLGGALAGASAVTLGGEAIAAALAAAGVEPQEVERVVMGQVLQAGQGQNPARQAAAAAGVGLGTPALTLNKVCLSGAAAVTLAAQAIRLDEAGLVVAGGMESMTGAPHLLPGARAGFRLGQATLLDAVVHDGLWCAFGDEHMGALSDRVNATLGLDRGRQDAWAARSHARAAAAEADGRLAAQRRPVSVADRRGRAVEVTADEGVRPETTVASLAALPPAFTPSGTITAGNASQLSDGAAALVLASAERAADLGCVPLGRVLASGEVAGPDATLHHQPAAALAAAAERAGVDARALDVYEINEAFAAVTLAAIDELGLDADRVNPEGGAVALGHPIGATGARLAVAVLDALRRRGGGRGAAALCGGGGQGEALLLETLEGG
ncbi:MAG: acetyl-CoA C-acyltransferase [Egibacteraceae bacterium]